jgi:hypothetical protein
VTGDTRALPATAPSPPFAAHLYDMDAAFMLLELLERGIQVV